MIFESKSLQRLNLHYCNLSHDDILHSDMSSSIHLKQLRLSDVCITDEILEKIIYSCPLIELKLSGCVGLRSIRIDKRARHLKRFEWSGSYDVKESPSLEIDVPSLEEINSHSDFFSHNFPCLESLSLKDCYVFEEFELSSRSIKKFDLSSRDVSLNSVIDVPSIVVFKYEGYAPESFSFTTTSKKWKSDITLGHDRLFDEASPRLGKVGQLLKAVSGSEISLDIRQFDISPHFASSFMDNLFCICRPRIIQRSLVVGPESEWKFHKRHNKTTELMCKILGMEKGRFESGRITRGRQWRQDLEKVIFETFDRNEEEWHPVLERSWSKFWETLLPEDDSKSVKHCMRFRLTWRE
ncbi:Putative F-box/LRR-repeat protein [Striga hermonthica]|uniref:F-box/LRR-repeat protein n=1 Tax=Striga hermonthica TaxID=68872 RepID=A0A9N7RKG9_STRHE|nr:Putative F-box/LRR-repeat protein [Striga hermonthica]